MSTYKAIDEFRANLDGGANPVLVKRGTLFTYDGNTLEVVGSDGVLKKGSVPMLKGQLGEWYVPVQETPAAGAQAPQVITQAVSQEQKAQAQAVVDSSAIGGTDVGAMVNRYDNQPNLRNREAPKIVDEDATIVRQVTKTAGDNKANTSGVQIEDSEVGKRTVVSQEERQVKATSYNPTLESTEPKKRKINVMSDSEGIVVKKASEKAIFKNEIRETKNVVLDKSAKEVSKEGDVVKEASYEKTEKVDLGSSTLTQTVVKTDEDKRVASNKAAAAREARLKQVSGDQEGTVVAKVRKDDATKSTADGFVAKLKVGGGDSSGDDIIGGDAVVSDGGLNKGFGEEAVVSSGGIVSISDTDDDVSIGDILDEMA